MTLRPHPEPDADGASDRLSAAFMDMRPVLLRFMMARGASRDDAADLLQDLFIKISQISATIILEPRAYLYRMADNLVLDQRRSAQRRTQRNEACADPNPDRDDRPSTEQALIAREQLGLVARALDTLPERTAAVFRRFRIEGQSQRAIAAEFGISLSAVEKHLQRAYRVVLEARAVGDADMTGPRRHMDTNGIFDV